MLSRWIPTTNCQPAKPLSMRTTILQRWLSVGSCSHRELVSGSRGGGGWRGGDVHKKTEVWREIPGYRNRNGQCQLNKWHHIQYLNNLTKWDIKKPDIKEERDKKTQKIAKNRPWWCPLSLGQNIHSYLQATCDIKTQFYYTGWVDCHRALD
jgi:hypothetical protein